MNLLEKKLKGNRFGNHIMLLLKTILEIYFKLAALTNFSGSLFLVTGGVGNSCFWLVWITSIAFTPGRKMFSAYLGKCSLPCSKNYHSKSLYSILAARKLEREQNNRRSKLWYDPASSIFFALAPICRWPTLFLEIIDNQFIITSFAW